jgi:hypothetical protein
LVGNADLHFKQGARSWNEQKKEATRAGYVKN